jgi:hypothetical protein
LIVKIAHLAMVSTLMEESRTSVALQVLLHPLWNTLAKRPSKVKTASSVQRSFSTFTICGHAAKWLCAAMGQAVAATIPGDLPVAWRR